MGYTDCDKSVKSKYALVEHFPSLEWVLLFLYAVILASDALG